MPLSFNDFPSTSASLPSANPPSGLITVPRFGKRGAQPPAFSGSVPEDRFDRQSRKAENRERQATARAFAGIVEQLSDGSLETRARFDDILDGAGITTENAQQVSLTAHLEHLEQTLTALVMTPKHREAIAEKLQKTGEQLSLEGLFSSDQAMEAVGKLYLEAARQAQNSDFEANDILQSTLESAQDIKDDLNVN